MRRWILSILLLVGAIGIASAQEDKKTDDLKPADPDTGESTVEEATLGLLPNSFEKQGVKFAVTYIGEVLGNPSGGLKQSAVYEDRINFAADVDFEKLVGLKQLTFHANVFQIDAGGLSRGALFNFLDVSGIEAIPTTRLYEIWFEQKWGTKLALRAGQLAADTEFMTAKYSDVFTNASLGWPAIFSQNLPSGGPSPPLATMGTRLRSDVSDHLTLIGAVFDGDAAGPGSDDPQLRDRYGVNSASTTRLSCWVKRNFFGMEKRVIPGSTANSRSAAGDISVRSATKDSAPRGFPSPIPPAAALRRPFSVITESIR
jgi:porin